MIKVEEGRNIILENTVKLQSETINITSSLNRILAEDIYSSENIPPFNNSAMDGFAVISAMVKGASDRRPSLLKVTGKVTAGETTSSVMEGNTAVKVMTGAPVPEGADAVIPVEYTEVLGEKVKIFREAVKWENIRFSGEDVKKGQLVIESGKLIRPEEIGMLAGLNIGEVKVTRLPKVSILATGSELIGIGEQLLPGKIRNINSYSLYAKALKHGCEVIDLGVARDDKNILKDKLLQGINSDILIISGGVSVGDCDYVKEVLIGMGMEEKFWKVAMKPGKPLLFGKLNDTLVFGLPGNPVSSVVAFEQFILPAIFKLQGRKKKPWYELYAILEGNIKKKTGLMHFVRSKLIQRNGIVYAKPIGSQSSGAFSTMVMADCLIVAAEDIEEVKDGERVLVQIIEEVGG